MSVDRCVCVNVSFAEMLELREQGLTFAEIRDQTGCCSGCGMCQPYCRLALATGAESIPILRGRDLARAWQADPDAGLASRESTPT
ncbi:MAG: hypothetical protein KDA16_01015 [Phycisphaerales bacterium]|nr:hypothetical protein [Phycisphaerales bacterium]